MKTENEQLLYLAISASLVACLALKHISIVMSQSGMNLIFPSTTESVSEPCMNWIGHAICN